MKTPRYSYALLAISLLLAACGKVADEVPPIAAEHTAPMPTDSFTVYNPSDRPDTFFYANKKLLQGLDSVWYQLAMTDSGWIIAGGRDESDPLTEPLYHANYNHFLFRNGGLYIVNDWDMYPLDSIEYFKRETDRDFKFVVHSSVQQIKIIDHGRKIVKWTRSENDDYPTYYISATSRANLPFVCTEITKWRFEGGNAIVQPEIVPGANYWPDL